MKNPKDIFFEMSEGLQTASRWIEIIEQTQKEAWNEAVELAAKKIYPVSNYSEMDRVHARNLKKDIIKLKK